MLVILQHNKPQRPYRAIGRVARDHVHLPARQRPIQQPQVHRSRSPGKPQPIRRLQPRQPVRPRLKLIPHPQPPALLRIGSSLHRVRDRPHPQPPRIVPPHYHRKRIFKTQPRLDPHPIPRSIQLTHPPKHGRLIPLPHRRQRLLQNRRQSRPRVLHIPINPPTHQSLLTQITPRQIKPPIHRLPGHGLNLLRQQLPQHHLLRKVLRPNRDPRRPRRRASAKQPHYRQHRKKDCHSERSEEPPHFFYRSDAISPRQRLSGSRSV